MARSGGGSLVWSNSNDPLSHFAFLFSFFFNPFKFSKHRLDFGLNQDTKEKKKKCEITVITKHERTATATAAATD